jgi:hypothetical protein
MTRWVRPEFASQDLARLLHTVEILKIDDVPRIRRSLTRVQEGSPVSRDPTGERPLFILLTRQGIAPVASGWAARACHDAEAGADECNRSELHE